MGSSKVANGARGLTLTQAKVLAREKFEHGDPSGVDDLAPVAAKLTPVAAVEMLELVSFYCDAKAVRCLLRLLGDVEYFNNALALSIMAGKTDVAKILIKKGGRLDATFEYVPTTRRGRAFKLSGDTYDRRRKRFIEYLEFALGGYYHQTKDSLRYAIDHYCLDGAYYLALYEDERLERDVFGKFQSAAWKPPCTGEASAGYSCRDTGIVTRAVEDLWECGALNEQQLASFALAAAHYRRFGDAKGLLSHLKGDLPDVALRVRRGPGVPITTIVRPLDLLYPGCDIGTVRFVESLYDADDIAEWLTANWSTAYLNHDPEVAYGLIPYLGPNTENKRSILSFAIDNESAPVMETVLSWEGVATRQLMVSCLDEAKEKEKIEMVAYLLAEMDVRFGATVVDMEL